MWVNCIKTGEKLKWISCTEYGKLGASVRSSKCLSAGGRCVCQGDRTSVKKRAYCQDIHCKQCASSLARQTGSEQLCSLAWIWLRQVGVTVKSKYLPCGFFWGDPIKPLFLWSQTLFSPRKSTTNWQKGCRSPCWISALHKHSRLGWSLTQCWGQVTLYLLQLGEVFFRSHSPLTNFSHMWFNYFSEVASWFMSVRVNRVSALEPFAEQSMMLHYFWTSSCAGCATDKNNAW